MKMQLWVIAAICGFVAVMTEDGLVALLLVVIAAVAGVLAADPFEMRDDD